MAEQQAPKIPLRLAARAHVTQMGTIEYKEGGRAKPFELPPVGLVNSIVLQVQGTITSGGVVPTYKNVTEQAWNIISRIRLNGNGGNINVIDLTGFEMYCVSHLLERSFKMDAPGAGSASVDPTLHRNNLPAAISTAYTFRQTFIIPVAANNGENFETGLINLQADQLSMTLDLDYSPLSEIYNNAPTMTNTQVEVGYLWYEWPNDSRVEPPAPLLVRLFSVPQDARNGANTVKADRQGTLMQQMVFVKVNGAYTSDAVSDIELKLNKNTTVYHEKMWQNRLFNRLNLGVDLPAGVAMFNFYHATQEVSEGDSRDMFRLDQYANFETIITIPNGTITDTATSSIRTVYRTLQSLQV